MIVGSAGALRGPSFSLFIAAFVDFCSTEAEVVARVEVSLIPPTSLETKGSFGRVVAIQVQEC